MWYNSLVMESEILKEIKELCDKHGVEPMYVFFTGSRAYGYHKEDSDFDILFVFKRPLADYFRVHPLPDEIKVADKDVKGWDLRKFCSILCKSGWNAYEALHCRVAFPFVGHAMSFNHLQHLAKSGDFYEPMKVAKTMVGCSARDKAKYDVSEGNKKLKYFLSYARMIMSAIYCVVHKTYPPVHFLTLAHATLPEPEKYDFIKELVEARKEGKDATPFLAKMEEFIETLKEESERIRERVREFDYKAKDADKMKLMDDFLYKTLTQN